MAKNRQKSKVNPFVFFLAEKIFGSKCFSYGLNRWSWVREGAEPLNFRSICCISRDIAFQKSKKWGAKKKKKKSVFFPQCLELDETSPEHFSFPSHLVY